MLSGVRDVDDTNLREGVEGELPLASSSGITLYAIYYMLRDFPKNLVAQAGPNQRRDCKL